MPETWRLITAAKCERALSMLGIPASTPMSVVMLLIERRTSSKVLHAPPPKKATVIATAPLSCLYKLRVHTPARPAASTIGSRMSRRQLGDGEAASVIDRYSTIVFAEAQKLCPVVFERAAMCSSLYVESHPFLPQHRCVRHLGHAKSHRSIERSAEDLCANASCSNDL